MGEGVIYTADDEEPDCGCCDHIDGPDDFCVKWCGPVHCWNGYSRTVYESVEEGLQNEV